MIRPKLCSFFIFIIFFNCLGLSQTIDTLIDLGDHQLHFNITKGEGIPILFESGGGNDGTIWNHLIEPIHRITGTTLITYDRPGYGQSTLNPNLPDDKKALIDHGIHDLEQGLQQLGYGDEIILVAHSYGGFYAQFFASKNPKKVKGIILLDVNLSCFWTDDFMKATTEIRTKEWLDNIKSLSPALYYECLSMPQTVANMKSISVPESIPIIDLVAENPPEFNGADDRQRWKSCHQQFAAARPNCIGITALECGHYLFYDNPILAINAIIKSYCDASSNIDFKKILQRSLSYGMEASNRNRQQEYEYWHSERETNVWGYHFLNNSEYEKALKIFELNTLLYPSSFNVWDSYGEALLKIGDKEKAIKMYQKSIELNPDHEDGKKMLEGLLKE